MTDLSRHVLRLVGAIVTTVIFVATLITVFLSDRPDYAHALFWLMVVIFIKLGQIESNTARTEDK